MKNISQMEVEPIWGGSIPCISADEETGHKQNKNKAKQLSKIVWGMIKRKKNLKGGAINTYSVSDYVEFSPSRAGKFDLFSDTEWNLDKEDRLDDVCTPFEKNLVERMFEEEEEDAITVASTPCEENPGHRNFDTEEETSKPHGQRMFDDEVEDGGLDDMFTPFEKNLVERMFEEEEEDAITVASTPYEENPGHRNFDAGEETSKQYSQSMFDEEVEEGGFDDVFTPFEKNLVERMFKEEEEEDAITVASTPCEENPGHRNFDTEEETSRPHGQRMFDEEEEEGAFTPNKDFFSEHGEGLTGIDCLLDIKRLEMSIANKHDRGIDDITGGDESEANVDIPRKLFYDDESVQRELEVNGALFYKTPKKLDIETPKKMTSELQITAPLKKQEFGPLLELECKDAAERAQTELIQVEMTDLWDAAKEVIEALNLNEDVTGFDNNNETSQEIGGDASALSKYNLSNKTVDEIVRNVTYIPPMNEVRVVIKKSLKIGGSDQIHPIEFPCTGTETGLEMRYKTPKKGLKQEQTTIILPSNVYSRCEVHTSSSSTARGMNTALDDSDVFDSIDSPDKPLRDPETSSLDSPDKSIHAKAVQSREFGVGLLEIDTCFPTFDLEASTDLGEMEKTTTKDENFSPFAKRCAELSKSSDEDDFTTETDKSQDLSITFGLKAKTTRQESKDKHFSPFEEKCSDQSGASGDKLPVKKKHLQCHGKLAYTSKPDFEANVTYNDSEESVESEVVLTPFTSFESETRTPVKENTIKDRNENDSISTDTDDDFANGFPSPVWDQTSVVTIAIKNSGLKFDNVDFGTCTPQKATKKTTRSAKDLPLMLSDAKTLLSTLQNLSLGMTASTDSNTEGTSKENVQDVLRSMKDECIERLDYNVKKISKCKNLQKSKSSTVAVRGIMGDGYKAPAERRATIYQERPALAEKKSVLNSLSSPVGATDFPSDEMMKDTKQNRQSGFDKVSYRVSTLGVRGIVGDKHNTSVNRSAPDSTSETDNDSQDVATFSISERIALLQRNFQK